MTGTMDELITAIQKLLSLIEPLYDDKKQAKSDLIDALVIFWLFMIHRDDGKEASQEETTFFAVILFQAFGSDEAGNIISKLQAMTKKGGSLSLEVPKPLVCLVEDDNNAYDTKRYHQSGALAFFNVFNFFGDLLIVCDGNASEQDVTRISTYLAFLAQYMKQNLKSFDAPAAIEVPIKPLDIIAGLRASVKKPDDNTAAGTQREQREESLEDLLQELNNLVGLEAVKKDVNTLIHLLQIRKLRKERGMKDIQVSNHLVFSGNPGTGKTTVARLLAKIYHAMGILSKGTFIETDRSGLVAGYVGQTAIKTKEVIDQAMGGVLFIDEAYSLVPEGNGNDFGQEAIETLLKAMEDHRDDFIVIVAGYTEPMKRFLNSNPGLQSRFNKFINFEDYDVDELVKIFKVMCEKNGLKADPDALIYAKEHFKTLYDHRDENFANGRTVRNFLEKAMAKQADRLFGKPNISNEELSTLTVEDLKAVDD